MLFLLLPLLLAQRLAPALGACAPDPEPPLAAPPSFAPAPPPSADVPPPPPPWIFERNSTQSFTLPVQPLPASPPPRDSCPHAAPGLLRWEDPATWPGGAAPASGEDVTLPAGAAILLSSCSSPLVLGALTIPAGAQLVLSDAPLSLSVTALNVGGALTAGSPSCRTLSEVAITLRGARPAGALTATPAANLKGILVEGAGVLDLHGAQYAPTWTRLAAPARNGSQWLYLQSPVNWEPGQAIILTTTALKDARDYTETEELTVAEVFTLASGMGAIRTREALRYAHYAGAEYQAEVALLSRRLVVQGDAADSPPTDAAPAACAPAAATASASIGATYSPYFTTLPCPNASLTGYGGHIMVKGPGARGRVSGALLLRMGQTNALGRYPFHLHLVNRSGANSFLRDSAVWRSYYRCVSLHGTWGAEVSSNVAHDVVGHCYYLEDGVEEENTFQHNLASLVHPLFAGAANSVGGANFFPASGPGASQEFSSYLGVSEALLLPADATASGFYITNARNRFVGNAASGGWSGFQFPVLQEPIGSHRNSGLPSPRLRPTLEFRGNTAHSSGFYWTAAGCIYVSGGLFYPSASDPSLAYNPGRASTFSAGGSSSHALTMFNDTKVFLCYMGIQHWGSWPEIIGFEAHDVMKAANVFGTAWVDNMLVTCRTRNAPRNGGGKGYQEVAFDSTSTALFQSYDIGQSHILTNVLFRNCSSPAKTTRNRQTFYTWQMLTHSDQFTPDTMIATAGVRYEGYSKNETWATLLGVTVNATYPTQSHRSQNWGDADGTLSRTGRPTQLGCSRAEAGWWWRLDEGCVNNAAWTMWACDATATTRSSGMVFLGFNETRQSTPWLGAAECSNGNYNGVPCEPVARVTHLGYPFAYGSDVSANARVSGPTGGFGWAFRWNWLASVARGFAPPGLTDNPPVALTVGLPQVEPDKVLLLAFPYPPDAQFRVTMFSNAAFASGGAPSYCRPSSNLCAFNFTRVGTLAEVRAAPNADRYFVDTATGHLYVRMTVQSGCAWCR